MLEPSSKLDSSGSDSPADSPWTIELQRETLYDEVWEIPVSRLAERYGLSDVGLRKVCQKLGVPTPPRGYWAKRQHGHDVRRAPLPPLADGEPEVHIIHRRSGQALAGEEGGPAEEAPGKDGATSRADEAEPPIDIPEIHVSARLRSPHPLVAKARDALKKGIRPDRYGRVQSTMGLGVTVTPESTNRSLRIMDALVKAADRLGWPVEERCGHLGEPCLLVEGEKVTFRLIEKVRQERHEAKDGYSWRKWKYEYHPTGRLRLEITSSSAPRSKWTDGKTGPALEERLGSFLEGVFAAAQAAKRWRKIREEEERKRQEAERRRLEAQQRREEEAARRRTLEAEAESWQKSEKLRAYIGEVRRRAAGQGLMDEEREAFERWLAWAEEHAGRLDPLSKKLPFTEEGHQREADDRLGREDAVERAASWFPSWRRFG